MRPLVIYFTRTNNTTPLAQAVAAELDADLFKIGDLPAPDLERQMQGRELIVLGSGIYNTRPPKQILRLIPKIQTGTKLFIFFTSGFTVPFLVRLYKTPYYKAIARQGVELLGIWNRPGHDKHPLFEWMNLNLERPNQEDLGDIRALVSTLKKPDAAVLSSDFIH